MAEQDKTLLAYVGTYNREREEGIYLYHLDLASGALSPVDAVSGVKNPSFLALGPESRFLYAVSEMQELDGKPGGGVSAFAIDSGTGSLSPLNQQSSQGAGPCHLSVDQTGRFVLVANYSSGGVAMLPVQDDGSLGEATDAVQHEGSSAHPQRQAGPHAHSITVSPENNYAFAADLGIDKIMVYRIDLAEGKLPPNAVPSVQVHAGAGPRHFAFHPNGRYAYLINELDNTVVAYTFDGTNGTLQDIQTLSTLPEGYAETSYCADIHVSPSGRFLYGTNRGHDSLAIFEIDEGTGKVDLVGLEPTQGEFPRNFAIDPTGSILLAANQNGDNIVSFRMDPDTGRLTPTGHITEVPAPVCIKMMWLSS
ncbi:MAG: lactonase family protein [Candidatus Latescibacteria bacterium]|jgi:6-phosphogluconolactonase|nr:lactonase family protein [Candidatus Latescibacterota bacterium]